MGIENSAIRINKGGIHSKGGSQKDKSTIRTTPLLRQASTSRKHPESPLRGQLRARSSGPRLFTRLSSLPSSLFPRPGLASSVFLIFVLFSSYAYAAQVSLQWDPVSHPDIAGYKIHYGNTSYNYYVTRDLGNQTSCTITGLVDTDPYYFATTAYDIYGNESEYSNEVCINCSKTSFSQVTRAQMAVFLLRTEHGSNYTPPPADGIFADVPVTFWAADWIEQLYMEGITSGCRTNPLQYCPADPVTRAQMAVFLLRTEHGSNYTPPPADGIFADVPVTFWAADWIEQLYHEGITTGCKQTPLSYCP